MGLPGMWFGIALANILLTIFINRLITAADWDTTAKELNQITERKSIIKGILNEKSNHTEYADDEDGYQRHWKLKINF